ncbi:MAG: hypothetical protein OT477_18240 [Chloroflexi bacterium]|nr:hypothetical protein [Chloroflexota bacterium]
MPTATPAPTLPASSRSLDLTLVAQTGGEATGLALSADGRLAYITVGPRLQVYDVADRANPTLQWQSDVFRRSFVGLMVEGEFAFGRLTDGWAIWRISSAVPELLWVSEPDTLPPLHPRGSLRTLKAEGKVYLAVSEDEWLVFDPSAPTFPLSTVTQAGHIRPFEGGLMIYQRTVQIDTLLFATEQTLPANIVGELQIPNQRRILAIEHPYVYLSATHPDKTDGLIIDISDITQPTILSEDFPIFFAFVQENGLWIGLEGERTLYDISQNPLEPIYLATFEKDLTAFYTPLATKDKAFLFINTGGNMRSIKNVWTRLSVLDFNNLNQPHTSIVYSLPPLSFIKAIPFGNNLFVLQNAQLTILDITNFETVVELGSINMIGFSHKSILVNDTIFSLGYNNGDSARSISIQHDDWPAPIERIPLIVGDVEHHPYLHQKTIFSIWHGGAFYYNLETNQFYNWEWPSWTTIHGPTRLASYDDYLVALNDTDIVVLDIADPVQPIPIGRYTPQNVAENNWRTFGTHLQLIDSIAFIASAHGVTVVDLTIPNSPQEIAFWPLTVYPVSLFSVGTALYYRHVAAEGEIVRILDVRNPSNPQLIQTVNAQLSGHLYGDFLIGDDYIYDVADPLNPLLVGETGVYGSIIGIRDNLLYVGSEAGVYVYEIRVRP